MQQSLDGHYSELLPCLNRSAHPYELQAQRAEGFVTAFKLIQTYTWTYA